ncbi:hypothetical protein C8J55DRAFT_489541 [Lentinula edodes]|uniref:BTB domain-containing protein n=1 Tax=Lentinula lateritia TaxID=40482 RepID=A0A9W9ADV4_9AGAR|nr:hypothetical protein C8J55DRAFT_489541 [Lentinula edodes]
MMDIDNGPISGDDLPEQRDKSPAVYKQHPLFYFEDANLFLKAQDSRFIYAVYKGMMAKFSETFEACFTFPQPQEKEEGTIFDNPILLPIDAAAFDVLCSFIFHLGWKSQSSRSTDELLILGRISQFLQYPDALKFGIAGLRFHSYDFNGEYSINMKIHKLLPEGKSNLSNCPQKKHCMKAFIKGWEVLGPAIGQTQGAICQVIERIEAFVNNTTGEQVKACIEQEHPEAHDVKD